MTEPKFSHKQPEFIAIAKTAHVDVKRAARGFSDPEHLYEHITLDELARLTDACIRIAALCDELAKASQQAAKALEGKS